MGIDSEIQCGLFVFQQSYLNGRFSVLKGNLISMHAGAHPAEKNQTKAQICIILKRDYKLILFAKPSQKPSSEDFSQN